MLSVDATVGPEDDQTPAEHSAALQPASHDKMLVASGMHPSGHKASGVQTDTATACHHPTPSHHRRPRTPGLHLQELLLGREEDAAPRRVEDPPERFHRLVVAARLADHGLVRFLQLLLPRVQHVLHGR